MLSKELQEIFSGQKKEVFIETLELSHSLLERPLYICKYSEPMELTIETGAKKTFLPSAFIVQMPKFVEESNLNIQITFSLASVENIRLLDNILRNSNERIVIKYRFYTLKNANYPAIQTPFKFEVTQGLIEGNAIVLRGAMLLSIQTQIPSHKMSYTNLRGLKYV